MCIAFSKPLAYSENRGPRGLSVAELHTVLTGLISGVGLVVPAVYFVGRAVQGDDSAARALWARLDLPHVYDRRRRRRTLGMAIMALISVVFFLGANYIDPRPHPNLSLLFWIVLLVMLVWLCVLALVDLAEVRRLRKRLLIAARQMFKEELGQCDPTGETRPGE